MKLGNGLFGIYIYFIKPFGMIVNINENKMIDFAFELALNEKDIQVRKIGEGITNDQYTQLIGKYPNRLRIGNVRIRSHKTKNTGKNISELSFYLIANPHPECEFEYICLKADLSCLPDSEVIDLSPKEVKGDAPIKYITKYKGGLKLDISTQIVGVFSGDFTMENEVYFVRIRGIGIGDNVATWTFEQERHNRLYFNNLLTILLEHSSANKTFEPTFQIEAHLRLKGWKGFIPLIGSKKISL